MAPAEVAKSRLRRKDGNGPNALKLMQVHGLLMCKVRYSGYNCSTQAKTTLSFINWYLEGNGNEPEVLEDWELWGAWTEGKNNTLHRVRFCRNKAFGGKCRGNSEEWRHRRRWKHVGEWSYEVPRGKLMHMKSVYLYLIAAYIQ